MATLKEVQSKINAVKSRLNQLENSPLFKEEEREKLATSLKKELQDLEVEFKDLTPTKNEQ